MTDQEIEQLASELITDWDISEDHTAQIVTFGREIEIRTLARSLSKVAEIAVSGRAVNVTGSNLALLALSDTEDQLRALKEEAQAKQDEVKDQGEEVKK